MKATSELVVPRSIPTMRSFAMIQIYELPNLRIVEFGFSVLNSSIRKSVNLSIFQRLIHIPNQIPDVASPIEQTHHPVQPTAPFLLVLVLYRSIPLVPVSFQLP